MRANPRRRSVYVWGAPYRYDGLYQVARHWHERGRDGYLIYRYELVAADPLSVPEAAFPSGNQFPERRTLVTQRILRDLSIGFAVKKLYDHVCQVCGSRLMTPVGPYAEVAHIRPLGVPAHGPDVIDNVLCLCPNDHVLLDKGAFSITDTLELLGRDGRLNVAPRHHISLDVLAYHRDHIYQHS